AYVFDFDWVSVGRHMDDPRAALRTVDMAVKRLSHVSVFNGRSLVGPPSVGMQRNVLKFCALSQKVLYDFREGFIDTFQCSASRRPSPCKANIAGVNGAFADS